MHLCSLLNSGPPALLGALADRLLIASRATGTGQHGRALVCACCPADLCLSVGHAVPAGRVCGHAVLPCAAAAGHWEAAKRSVSCPARAAGRAEVSGRGISALQPLLLGWTSLAMAKLVPGGAARVRRELRALVSSYDASHLGAAPLERLAAAGFPDVAAAVAAR